MLIIILMKKTKFNPSLLKEEQNRFKLLLEYDFYQEKKEIPEFKNLILGDTMDEVEEAPADLEPEDNIGDAADSVSNNTSLKYPVRYIISSISNASSNVSGYPTVINDISAPIACNHSLVQAYS